MKYMVLDTDYSTHDFDDLKEAEAFYLEKCTEVLTGDVSLDGSIVLMNVMTAFTIDDIENLITKNIQGIKETLPSQSVNKA